MYQKAIKQIMQKNIKKHVNGLMKFKFLDRKISGKVAPWSAENINMEGGAGQLNVAFTWQLMLDSGIVTNNRTITIK